jgi:adenine-specific DNA methylase
MSSIDVIEAEKTNGSYVKQKEIIQLLFVSINQTKQVQKNKNILLIIFPDIIYQNVKKLLHIGQKDL